MHQHWSGSLSQKSFWRWQGKHCTLLDVSSQLRMHCDFHTYLSSQTLLTRILHCASNRHVAYSPIVYWKGILMQCSSTSLIICISPQQKHDSYVPTCWGLPILALHCHWRLLKYHHVPCPKAAEPPLPKKLANRPYHIYIVYKYCVYLYISTLRGSCASDADVGVHSKLFLTVLSRSSK